MSVKPVRWVLQAMNGVGGKEGRHFLSVFRLISVGMLVFTEGSVMSPEQATPRNDAGAQPQ